MKKILALFFLSFLFLSSAIFSVNAAYDFSKNSGISEIAPKIGYEVGSEKTPEYYIGNILSIFFSFVGIIFFILTIYSGIKWMTAQGNTSQVSQAKDILIKAVVGLIICLLAYSITFFVVNIFQK